MSTMHSEKISTATSTSSSENRKSSKPIMEKRRRARMNASLAELKSLLLEVMKKDGNRHSKMEKADILEMTVKHLRHLQRQHFTVPTTKEESPFLTKYTLGFQECTSEVSRYLSSVAEVDTEIRARLLNHLATYISQPSTPSSSVSSTASSPTSTTSTTIIPTPISRPSSVTDTSPRQSPASLASPSSPSASSTPQLVSPSQTAPPPPPAQIQLQLTPSLAPSVSSLQSSQISVSTAQTTTRPESMVAPKQITLFPADFCTATTTPTATTFTAPATGGILSLDTSCPQIQTAKLLSGVQLITTRLPNGQMAFVLPTNLMTETQQQQQQQQPPQPQQQQQPQPQQRQQSQQSYIPIPVYAPTSSAISPLTPTVGGAPGVMALLPQVSKTGVTPTASMAFMPHLFPIPQMTGINSSISHLPLITAETTESVTTGAVTGSVTSAGTGTGLTLPLKLSPSVTETNHQVSLPELTKKLASTPLTQAQTTAKREENNVVEPAPVLQQIEEDNVWRPWAH